LNTTYEVDGLTLETSDKGTSGWLHVIGSNTHYEGAVFTARLPDRYIPAHLDNPWPGMRGGPTVGSATDPREAAYLTAKAIADPAWGLANLATAVIEFNYPAELYNLPRGIRHFNKKVADKAARKAANTAGTVKATKAVAAKPKVDAKAEAKAKQAAFAKAFYEAEGHL